MKYSKVQRRPRPCQASEDVNNDFLQRLYVCLMWMNLFRVLRLVRLDYKSSIRYQWDNVAVLSGDHYFNGSDISSDALCCFSNDRHKENSFA